MLLVPLEGDFFISPVDFAIDPDPGISFLVQVFYDLQVGPLLLPDDR